jgi:hypothetical protein
MEYKRGSNNDCSFGWKWKACFHKTSLIWSAWGWKYKQNYMILNYPGFHFRPTCWVFRWGNSIMMWHTDWFSSKTCECSFLWHKSQIVCVNNNLYLSKLLSIRSSFLKVWVTWALLQIVLLYVGHIVELHPLLSVLSSASIELIMESSTHNTVHASLQVWHEGTGCNSSTFSHSSTMCSQSGVFKFSYTWLLGVGINLSTFTILGKSISICQQHPWCQSHIQRNSFV